MSKSQHQAAEMEAPLSKVLRFLGQCRAEATKTRALTPSQLGVLRLLNEGGERRMSEVAAAIALSNSACTVMSDQLEKRGLVHKRMDPEDRRAVQVAITDEGRALLKEMLADIHQALAERLDRLSAAERQAVVAGFEALARVMDEA
ncbi:MarR family transcriptional regulator [bacterium]|nr:MarR family transcriptional regulator [bacterium]